MPTCSSSIFVHIHVTLVWQGCEAALLILSNCCRQIAKLPDTAPPAHHTLAYACLRVTLPGFRERRYHRLDTLHLSPSLSYDRRQRIRAFTLGTTPPARPGKHPVSCAALSPQISELVGLARLVHVFILLR